MIDCKTKSWLISTQREAENMLKKDKSYSQIGGIEMMNNTDINAHVKKTHPKQVISSVRKIYGWSC